MNTLTFKSLMPGTYITIKNLTSATYTTPFSGTQGISYAPDFGPGQVSPFGQWNMSKCDANRGIPQAVQCFSPLCIQDHLFLLAADSAAWFSGEESSGADMNLT